LYLVYASVKHLIADAATLTALGLSTSSVITATTATLGAFPTGTSLGIHYVQGQAWPFALISSGTPGLFADPPAAASGAIVRISGSHFGASETVQIRYANGAGALDVMADAAG